MLKQLLYLLIALVVVFVVVKAAWSYFGKKKRDAALRAKSQDPRYLNICAEKEEIIEKRKELENTHPYQRFIFHKNELKKAEALEDKELIDNINTEINKILSRYDDVDETRLFDAYYAQLEAMNSRLSQIEIEQRQIILRAEKII